MLKFVIILTIINLSFINSKEDDQLSLNIIPSDKYRLNKRDLITLQSDIERQLMQRVFEIQSNWDEREKLRHFAISRPPVVPPWPIVSPAYTPDLVSYYPRQSSDRNRVDKNINNNSGPSSYAFMEKNMENTENNERNSIFSIKNSLDKELRETKAEIERIKNEKYYKNKSKPKEKEINSSKIESESTESFEKELIESNDKHNKPNNNNNYDKIVDDMYNNLKSRNVNENLFKKMIVDKDKKEVINFHKFLKEHPDVLPIKQTSSDKPDYKRNLKVQPAHSNTIEKNKKNSIINTNVIKKKSTNLSSENKNIKTFTKEVNNLILHNGPLVL